MKSNTNNSCNSVGGVIVVVIIKYPKELGIPGCQNPLLLCSSHFQTQETDSQWTMTEAVLRSKSHHGVLGLSLPVYFWTWGLRKGPSGADQLQLTTSTACDQRNGQDPEPPR